MQTEQPPGATPDFPDIRTFRVGVEPVDIAVLDMDRDGLRDPATLGDEVVSLLRNLGDGDFEGLDNPLVSTGSFGGTAVVSVL